ncbi:hypothetical protein ACFQS2_03320 [Brachybacterium sp. GCM10030267]
MTDSSMPPGAPAARTLPDRYRSHSGRTVLAPARRPLTDPEALR